MVMSHATVDKEPMQSTSTDTARHAKFDGNVRNIKERPSRNNFIGSNNLFVNEHVRDDVDCFQVLKDARGMRYLELSGRKCNRRKREWWKVRF